MSSLQGYIDRTLPHFFTLFNSAHSKNIGRVLLVLQDGRAIVVAYTLIHHLPCLVSPKFTTASFPLCSFAHLADAVFFFWMGKQGVLAGYDQKSNVVLSDSKERVYSLDEGVEEVPLGLYLVKGDMMYVAARSFPLPTSSVRRAPHRHRHYPAEKVSPRANYTTCSFFQHPHRRDRRGT